MLAQYVGMVVLNIIRPEINPALLKYKNYFLKVISGICVSTPFNI